jgi:Malectin domain
MNSQEIERQELDRALELLGRGTRHARLLEYVGAKYFERQEDQLTEFNIATEVFGRSAQRFAATQDAVVRVEAHRLRKKLRDIYEKDVRAQGLQISLPPGTYVPKFTAVPDPPPNSGAGGTERFPKKTLYLSILAVAVVVVVGLAIYNGSPEVKSAVSPSQASHAGPSSGAANGKISELHVLAGYGGSEVIDSSGVRWTPDRYFANGGQWSRDGGFLRGTSRPFLFANWRTGEFGYDIPVAPGVYEMRLFFVSPQRVGEEKLAGFNVALNGKGLLEAFDANMSANGADVAEEQVFRDIKPGEDGFVRLWFSNQSATPNLNALELVPGIPGKLKPIRILTQPTSFVDHKGQRWRADDYYLSGFRSTDRRKVSGTEDPELFGTERFGHFSYAIPVDRRGSYTVVLHFAEFYYGPQLPGGGGVGRRIFHVFCNGNTLLRDFDIYKEAGSLQVITKTFSNIRPSAQGKINLNFEPVVNNATVSGIEVLEEPN